MTSTPVGRALRPARRVTSTAALVAAVLALVVGCSSGSPPGSAIDQVTEASNGTFATGPPTPVAPSAGSTTGSVPTQPASPAPPASALTEPPPPPSTTSSASVDEPGLPATIQPVPQGELVSFQVRRQGAVLIDAGSSGLARYNSSASCEVPGQPCYDAPTFDKVARIDLGAPPQVPGTETTFITGHSNRYRPDDASKGVFSGLQNARTGDTLVIRTTRGTFVYDVTTALTVPFDRLTTTPQVVDVRKDTVVAISCVIAPDRGSYLGNFVVVGSLRAAAPL